MIYFENLLYVLCSYFSFLDFSLFPPLQSIKKEFRQINRGNFRLVLYRHCHIHQCVEDSHALHREVRLSDIVHLLAKGGYGTLLIGETRESNFGEGVCRDSLKTE
jgi:hypothetical protein